MSKRNGPSARDFALPDDRRGTGITLARNMTQRYSRAEYAKVVALQEEVGRADGDYQRLRNAYLDVARNEPSHEVALGMIGADMDRAHARLQALIGLPRLPYTHEPSTVMRREALLAAEEKH